jgi:hypothetical protein
MVKEESSLPWEAKALDGLELPVAVVVWGDFVRGNFGGITSVKNSVKERVKRWI